MRIVERLGAYKLHVLIFLLALSVRLLLIAIAPEGPFYSYGLGADGSDYVNEAHNLVEGRGFSRANAEPYTPDAIRTPLYPLFLAGVYVLTGSFAAAAYVEAVLGSIIPLIAMGVVGMIVRRRSLLILTGLFFALEPHMAFYTTFFASEGISILLLYAGFYSLLRWYRLERIRDAALGGALLGLSALARPITTYVPLVLWPLFACAGYLRKNLKRHMFLFVVFAVMFFVVLFPWLMRNQFVFGTFGMGTVGWFNVYTRLAATVLAIDNGKDFYTSYYELLDELALRGHVAHPPPVSEYEIQDPRFAPVLREESLRILGQHKEALAKFVVTGTVAVLTQDNTVVVLETLTGLKPQRPPFSPTLYVAQRGVVEGAQALLPYLKGLYLLPYLGRAFWTGLLFLSVWGFWILMRRGWWFEALVCAGCITYITLFTLNAGAQIDGRYRLQFLLAEAALAAAALDYMIEWIRRRYGR